MNIIENESKSIKKEIISNKMRRNSDKSFENERKTVEKV